MNSYQAFTIVNAATLFRSGAEELGKVIESKPDIVVGRVAVCADKIANLIKKSQKEFEVAVVPPVRDRLRTTLERELGVRIRTTARLWEVLHTASKHMNDIHHATTDERKNAQTICMCLSELFPE